jgi:hypothetical protein
MQLKLGKKTVLTDRSTLRFPHSCGPGRHPTAYRAIQPVRSFLRPQ